MFHNTEDRAVMNYLLFLLFISIPILEISVFVSVGGVIGLGSTLAVVILTAAIGTWMLKRQGLKTLVQVRYQLNQGQLPLREVFDGFCLLLAGAFLLTPGFVTDGVGFLLFMPPFRSLLSAIISRVFIAHRHFCRPGLDKTAKFHEPFDTGMKGNMGGPTIDGEFKDLTGQNQTEEPKTGSDAVVRRIDK